MKSIAKILLGLSLWLVWPMTLHAATVSTPTTLLISKIKVSAPIQARGLNGRKTMLPPTTSKAVAWYSGGVLPGRPGTAIMYGHLTDNSFRPAVFTNLHTLKVKDKIIVRDSKRRTLTYVVTKISIFSSTKITSRDLTPPTRFSHLTLYTCAGHWVPSLHKYSQFLVVYTSLQSVK